MIPYDPWIDPFVGVGRGWVAGGGTDRRQTDDRRRTNNNLSRSLGALGESWGGLQAPLWDSVGAQVSRRTGWGFPSRHQVAGLRGWGGKGGTPGIEEFWGVEAPTFYLHASRPEASADYNRIEHTNIMVMDGMT